MYVCYLLQWVRISMGQIGFSCRALNHAYMVVFNCKSTFDTVNILGPYIMDLIKSSKCNLKNIEIVELLC